jgi:hypothetical protein
VRLAYVAATRARDMLVVPVIGDEMYPGSWLDPLMTAVYPSLVARESRAARRDARRSCSRDSVVTRPDGDPARPTTVSPGAYRFGDGSAAYSVVWWDPHILALNRNPGLRTPSRRPDRQGRRIRAPGRRKAGGL